MQIVEGIIERTVGDCWRAFLDVPKLASWVPALRSARTIEDRGGLPYVIEFELVSGATYSLVYDYDLDERVVRWAPRATGGRGVSGEARFEDCDRGTRFTYSIEQHGRSAAERALDDPHALVAAFTDWMDRSRD